MTLLAVSHQPQHQDSDCLAACSAMVLDYLHIPYTYPQLLRLLQIQPFGTWFRNIQFLQSLGLTVSIGYGDVETLERHLDVGLPIIRSAKKEQLYCLCRYRISDIILGRKHQSC